MTHHDLTDRQIVYCLFYLKRLAAQGRDRPTMSRKGELTAALTAAMTHAAQNFADTTERAAAIEDAEVAAVAVEALADQPDFDARRVISELEETQSARLAAAQASPPRAQENPPPAAPAQAAVGTAPPPRASSLKVALIAACVGAVAGLAGGWLMRGPSAPSLQAAVGDWRWEGGAKVSLGADGRFTFNDRPAGYFFAGTDRDFVLVHANGRFIDYLSLNTDGTRLTGFSAAGAAVNGTRMR